MTDPTPARPIQLDDNLQEVLDHHPRTLRVFVDHRMACPGCDMAPYETVADAADAYDLPQPAFLEDLREADADD